MGSCLIRQYPSYITVLLKHLWISAHISFPSANILSNDNESIPCYVDHYISLSLSRLYRIWHGVIRRMSYNKQELLTSCEDMSSTRVLMRSALLIVKFSVLCLIILYGFSLCLVPKASCVYGWIVHVLCLIILYGFSLYLVPKASCVYGLSMCCA